MLLTTVMVVTILPPLHAQSLADAAKQAAEQRAKAKQEQSKPAGTKDSDKTDAPQIQRRSTQTRILPARPPARSGAQRDEKERADRAGIWCSFCRQVGCQERSVLAGPHDGLTHVMPIEGLGREES
jgi:hypothetical protein